MHPFLAFCLYVAARVIIHAYKKRPVDGEIKNHLEFLLSSMQAHRKKNQLTESFLVQLTCELEAAGLDIPLSKLDFLARLTAVMLSALQQKDTCTKIF